MLHVYRQVAGLCRVRAVALAFKRENSDHFPYGSVKLLHQTRLRWLRRWWTIQLRKQPQLAYPSETHDLATSLERNRCRLIHIYFGNNGVFWLPFLRRTQFPTIVSFHGADVQVNPDHSRQLLHEVFLRSRLILTRSESLVKSLTENGCPPEKIVIQRTGIPLDEYSYMERMIPPNGEWKLLQACRLVEKKGLESTIRAFGLFSKRWPNVTLKIAGDGPLRERLNQLIDSLGLGNRILITGFLSPAQLREAYYESHLFLHPSETAADGNREGVPNSLLEAMATGLPSVATYHSGIPEAIEDQKSGLLVPECDSNALAIALARLTEEPGFAKHLGTNGSERVRTKFDLAVQIQRLEEIYLKLLDN